MSENPFVREAFVISIFVTFALALAYAPAWAGDKTAPGSMKFGEVKVVGPTKGQGSLSVPSKVPSSTPPGMLKNKAALPLKPKHYKLDPEAGAVRFGDGQHGSRLPTGHGPKDRLVLGNIGSSGEDGAPPLPPPHEKLVLGNIGSSGEDGVQSLPPPQGVSPADPTSPTLPAGDTVPMEDVSLNYDEVEDNYKPQSPSGKSKGNVKAEWKVEEGEK